MFCGQKIMPKRHGRLVRLFLIEYRRRKVNLPAGRITFQAELVVLLRIGKIVIRKEVIRYFK